MQAVLLSCHGTVERTDDLPAFVTNIRRGRPPPPEVVEEVRRRFERIGGSPLMRIAREQADALSRRLGVPVRAAGRLWHPYPHEVLAALHLEGARQVVSLPLAPQSVHVYHPPVLEAAARLEGMRVRCAPSWGQEPALLDAFMETIDEGFASVPPEHRAATVVVLTAHSLPQRIIDGGDPYERDFRAMAACVAERLVRRRSMGGSAPPDTIVAFQSQGMTGDTWLGPDLPTTFAALVARGVRSVLIAPIGFVADHVETLYDLDVEAHQLAADAGLASLARAPGVNARPRFIDALEAIARRELEAF